MRDTSKACSGEKWMRRKNRRNLDTEEATWNAERTAAAKDMLTRTVGKDNSESEA
jgi:hypothetical protein